MSGSNDSSLLLLNPQLMGPYRQMAYGQALLGQASDVGPLRSPWQAAARALSGALGGYEFGAGQRGLTEATDAMDARRQQILQGVLGGGDAGTAAPMGPQVNAPAPSAAASPGGGRVPTVNDPNIANNNYGNIRPVGATKGFQVYDTPEDGIAAHAQQLVINQKNHGLNTLRQQITRWAPKYDENGKQINDPDKYATNVGSAIGVDPDKPLDFSDPAVLAKVIPAMAQIEHGKPIGVGPDVVTSGIAKGLGGGQVVAINGAETGGNSDTSAGAHPASGANPGGLPPGIAQAIQMRRQGMVLMMDRDPRVQALGQSMVQQAAAYTQMGAFGPMVDTPGGGKGQFNQISGEFKQVVQPLRPEAQILSEFSALAAKASSGQPLTPAEQAAYGTYYNKLYPITTEVRGNTTVALQKTQPPPNIPYPWEVSGGQAPANFLNPRAAAGGGAPAAPTTAPQTEAQIEFEKTGTTKLYETSLGKVAEYQNAATEGQKMLADTQTIRSLAAQAYTGKGADTLLQMKRFLTDWHIDSSPLDSAAAGGAQALEKMFLQLSFGAVRNMGAREPGSVIQMTMSKYPNLESNPHAIDILTRVLDMQQRYASDQAEAMGEYINTQRRQAAAPGGSLSDFQGLTGFKNTDWYKQHDPRIYSGAALAAAHEPPSMWGSGLTKDQKVQALKLAAEQYPTMFGTTGAQGQ